MNGLPDVPHELELAVRRDEADRMLGLELT